MTERLSDVEERLSGVHQLELVVNAMRGVAASRSRDARNRLLAVRAYANTIGNAIGEALALVPEDGQIGNRPTPGNHILIVLCAEQGFVGAFNNRVLSAAEAHLGDGASELLLAGDRGLMVAAERGLSVVWSSPMPTHVEDCAALANRLAEAVYERLTNGATRVTIVHATPTASMTTDVVVRTLVPLDLGRFPVSRRLIPPLITQDPGRLIMQLADEYMFAELSEAVTLSFAAENIARMNAMIAARDNVEQKLGELKGLFRRLRQEGVTNEIVELASGTATAVDGSA
jgi:F-type H+-transporting ATPase subunit gamma